MEIKDTIKYINKINITVNPSLLHHLPNPLPSTTIHILFHTMGCSNITLEKDTKSRPVQTAKINISIKIKQEKKEK